MPSQATCLSSWLSPKWEKLTAQGKHGLLQVSEPRTDVGLSREAADGGRMFQFPSEDSHTQPTCPGEPFSFTVCPVHLSGLGSFPGSSGRPLVRHCRRQGHVLGEGTHVHAFLCSPFPLIFVPLLSWSPRVLSTCSAVLPTAESCRQVLSSAPFYREGSQGEARSGALSKGIWKLLRDAHALG